MERADRMIDSVYVASGEGWVVFNGCLEVESVYGVMDVKRK